MKLIPSRKDFLKLFAIPFLFINFIGSLKVYIMKKFYYSFLAVCALSLNVNAQAPVFDWATPFSGTTDESGRSVAVDADGNIYSTGVFTGTTDFDPTGGVSNLIATGGQDVYITKQDSTGDLVWAKKIGGTVTDNSSAIKVDNNGHIYVVGSFNGVCTFGITPLNSAGMGDAFITKLDTAGNFLWAKKFGSTGNEQGIGVVVDGSGNVFTTGYFSNTCDFDPDGVNVFNLSSSGGLDIFVSKLDASGNYVAAYKFGGTGFDLGFDIALDAAGSIYTTGYFNGTADFDPGAGSSTLNAGSGEDIYINKITSSGNFAWAKQMSGTNFNNAGYGLVVSGAYVYSTGYFSGTVDFDPGGSITSVISLGNTDSYISKLDTAGNFVSVYQIGGAGAEGSYSIALDGSGNIFTAGDFSGTTDFDPGAGTSNLTSGTLDVYLCKLNSAGVFSSVIQIATSNGDPSMCIDNFSNLYITGGFTGTTDFDAGAGTVNLIASGGIDAYVTKYNDVSCIVGVTQPGPITGNSPICAGSSNTYSISTVSGATSYTWTLPGGWTGTSTTTSINTTASATSGNILVTANDACGSSLPQSLAITVSNPALLLSVTGPSCADSCDGSISPSTSGGIPGYSYMPFPLTDLCAGNYTVTVTDNLGCIGTATATISNPTPVSIIIFASDTILCTGDVSNVSLNGADTYTWGGSSSPSTFSFSPGASAYWVAVGTVTATGCSASDSVYFTVNPLPVVDFTYPGNDTVCITDGIQTLSGGSPAGGVYSGSGVSGTSFDPNAAGLGLHAVTYTFTDANSCSASDAATITVIGCSGIDDGSDHTMNVYPNPFIDQLNIEGVKGTIEVELCNVWGETLYIWNVKETNPVISTFDLVPGIYFLRTRTEMGINVVKIIKQN